MVLEIQAAGANDGKNRRGVCGADHRSDQEAFQPVHTQRQMAEQAGKSGCQHNAGGRQ